MNEMICSMLIFDSISCFRLPSKPKREPRSDWFGLAIHDLRGKCTATCNVTVRGQARPIEAHFAFLSSC